MPTTTPTPIPPTATATPTPFPLTANLSITKLSVWDFYGLPAEGPFAKFTNCYDLELTNENEQPIRFSFLLNIYDENGVSYDDDIREKNAVYTSLRLDAFTQHLPPGETFLDRRCWENYPEGYDQTLANRPITRMEATLQDVQVSTLFDGWQKIGVGGVQLDDIKIGAEPSIPENYPDSSKTASEFVPQWNVSNTSDSTGYWIKACTAYRWQDKAMYAAKEWTDYAIQVGTNIRLHAENIEPGSLFGIGCQTKLVDPKQAATLENNWNSGYGYRLFSDSSEHRRGWEMNNWNQQSLYLEVMGLWARVD